VQATELGTALSSFLTFISFKVSEYGGAEIKKIKNRMG
jgi:hypothetical protein